MLPGAYLSFKKDHTPYYRSSITYLSKHISLGSFSTEKEAHMAYMEAQKIYQDASIHLLNYKQHIKTLSNEKVILLLNHRDHKIYFKTPIYLQGGYFSYYLYGTKELKFDNDDLFYYSSHKILLHDGHYYVNDYGMQYGILARYGIKNHAVAGKDYQFANGDSHDFRYQNIIVINRYHGVTEIMVQDMKRFITKIHINGEFIIGRFRSDAKAAVAYNKACDLAKNAGITKEYTLNYVLEYTPKEYAEIYTSITMPKNFLTYLNQQKKC